MPSVKERLPAYLRLIRFDRPTGTVLVLMPTLWSLWIASDGHPSVRTLFIFTAGCFLMRSAGCAMNDVADREFDRRVRRTRNRPVASGEVSVGEAVGIFLLFSVLSFVLVLFLNPLSIALSVIGFLLALLYPFSKRVISIPQFVLGISFGWGILMAWGAVRNTLSLAPLLIFAGNICWSLAYDTIYALMDIEDDLKIGVKSSAIFFGKHSWFAVGVFLLLVLLLLGWAGFLSHLGSIFYLFLLITGGAFAWQVFRLKRESGPDLAMRLFKGHATLGTIILVGIVSDYLLR